MCKIKTSVISLLLAICVLLSGCGAAATESAEVIGLDNLPVYSTSPYVAVNGNVPYFTQDEYITVSFEQYSELDALGRCGEAYANVGVDLMPTEKRGSIGQVKPSGWHTVKYDNVDGKYLYNRCHLIGYQLTAENANEKNLITGTRYLNVEGMLPFENMVADYVKETENHVLYRVTPIFKGNNLVASGVLMEAWSVEDNGEGICFNVYCYNVQPGIAIDYLTGESYPDGTASAAITATENETESGEAAAESEAIAATKTENGTESHYILNTSSMKFHYADCSGAAKMNAANRQEYTGSREELISMGYSPCGTCKP